LIKKIEYQLIDIIKQPSLIDYLKLALKQFSADKTMIFNIRGKAFKLINPNIYSLSKEKIFKLLLGDCKLIKRPFWVYEEKK